MNRFTIKSQESLTQHQKSVLKLHDSLNDYIANKTEVRLTLDDLVCKPRDKAHERLIDLGMLIAADIIEVE